MIDDHDGEIDLPLIAAMSFLAWAAVIYLIRWML